MNAKPLILETNNIDLNRLISFSYTFENLKKFMSSIKNNQTLMSNKINELENQLKLQTDINTKYQMNLLNLDKKALSLESNLNKIIKKEKKVKLDLSKKELQKDEIFKIDKEKEIIKDIKKDKEKETNIEIKEEKFDNKKKEEKAEKEKEKAEFNKDKIKLEPNENEINLDKEETPDKKIIDEKKREDIKKNIENKKEIVKKEIKLSDKSIIKESSFSKDIEGEFDQSISNEYNQEFMEIKNRLLYIENKLKEYDLSLSQQKFQLFNDSSKKEEMDLIKNQIKGIIQKNEEFRQQKDDLQKKVEEISIKVLDFNIIEILKNTNINSSQLDSDKLIALNLEQKFQKKTSILNEKAKKTEDEIYKIKNNFESIKTNFNVIEENFNSTKNNIKDIKEEIIKTNINYRNLMTELNNKLNEVIERKIETQKRSVDKNLFQIRQQIKNINDKKIILEEETNKIGSGLSDTDLKYISELSKKVTDLERQMPLIFRNFESIKNKDNNELTKIENELTQKINQKDFFDLNDKVNMQNTISNNIREMVERVQELTNKNMKDLNFFLRKIESLSGSVISIQNVIENLTGMKQEETSFEVINFLEKESFNEFTKAYNKEKKIFERNFDEFRRILGDISEIIKHKASEDDLKNFEAIMNNKIEELKINCGKKFADKIDTAKNLKYLDTQIRYNNELFIKREKNDGWLLAKKPVGGYSCASCESYIGDLKEKGDFVAWNKYPQREKNIEKNYRVGNGFSRMLSMLNIDIKNNLNNIDLNNYESDEENANQNIYQTNNTINFNISQGMKNSASNKNRNSLKSINQIILKNNLPKINSVDNIINNEKSFDDYRANKTIETVNSSIKYNEIDSKKPHIIKVFKKK